MSFTNMHSSIQDEEFHPSIHSQDSVPQPMIFQTSSGQFHPPNMLQYGFKPITHTTSPPTTTVIPHTTVGQFSSPSEYNYGFKPVVGEYNINNKIP